MFMAVDVVAAAVLPVFCSARRSPIRREALASAWSAAVERVNLVPRDISNGGCGGRGGVAAAGVVVVAAVVVVVVGVAVGLLSGHFCCHYIWQSGYKFLFFLALGVDESRRDLIVCTRDLFWGVRVYREMHPLARGKTRKKLECPGFCPSSEF